MSIEAVIWDLGGVLVRTEDYTSRQALADRVGVSIGALEELVYGLESGRRAQLGEIPLPQHWENVRQELRLTRQAMQDFRRDFWAGDRLDLELVDYIRSLRGRYRIGLLSNAFSDLRQVLTDTWGIADAFDEIIISAEVGLAKPDERIYRLALEQLMVSPSQAVFIDDFRHNIDAAQAVGLHVVHFQNPAQARLDLKAIFDGHTR